MTLGIDVGGANTKAASSDGGFTFSRYAPVWEGADVGGVLREIAQTAGPVECVGVVVTAELSDIFASKAQGLAAVERAVRGAYQKASFFGYDGRFHPTTGGRCNFAGANWAASARLLARRHPDAILVDVGSTTTDIIPVVGGEVRGLPSDLERLGASQLVYSGAQRTNVAALLQSVRLDGREYRVASEMFATTADAYTLLGELPPGGYTCTPSDRLGNDIESCARRLARVVCCDLEELGMEGARAIAAQVKVAQVRELRAALQDVASTHGLRECLLAGSGEFISRQAVEGLGWPCTSISREYDAKLSAVFPAYAVARLLEGAT